MAIDKTKLTNYVNQNKDIILKNVLLGAPSISLFSKMLGVKGDANLNLLETAVAFGDGRTCGFSDNATATLSTRKMETAEIKVDAAFCQRALAKYWLENELNVEIGAEKLPAEDKFIDSLVTAVSEKLENMIYYGNKSNTGETEFDGLITICDAETANTASTINKVTATSAQTMYARTQAVIKAIPSKFYGESTVLMSVTSLRQVIADFEAANPYKSLEFVGEDKLSFRFPNTNIIVRGVEGMETTNANHKDDIISIVPRLTFYGCDKEGANENFEFYFNQHDSQFEFKTLFNSGMQVAYIDSVVYCPTV